MRYYKKIEDGYIAMTGVGAGGVEITAEEYVQLKEIFYSMPEAAEGYAYRLKEDLTWEEYEIPVSDHDEEEISDEEALNIITGGIDA